MKMLQSQETCLKGRDVSTDTISGFPSDFYPNSNVYCYHDFYELELFTEGDGKHFLNGIPYRVARGYLYLIAPGDYHYMQLSCDAHFTLYNMKATVDIPSDRICRELMQYPHPYCVYLNEEMIALAVSAFSLLNECCNESKWNDPMKKSAVDCLFSLILYAISKNQTAANVSNNQRLSRLMEYIGIHYAEELSLSELASEICLSEPYFGIYFYEQTGMHIRDYINRVRLYHAVQLISDTDLTVKEIAYRVGFSSPEYLARKFREVFHAAPLDYRKK